jgi:hypothetical protein
VLDSFGLELELLAVRRLPNPILLGHGRFADMIHADRVIDVLQVAPTIWAAIFQEKYHARRIWRVMLNVMVLDGLTVTRHEDFHRGMRVTIRALVKRSFNPVIGSLLADV